MAELKSSSEKKQIVDLLNRIAMGTEKQLIKSEKDLEMFIRIMLDADRELASLYGGELNPTLLELLGYTSATCDDHPYLMTIVGHTKYSPDYVLSSGQKTLAILDLKAPGINLDTRDWKGQIQSYCARGDKNAPIGILFNGKSIRVFINPDYPGFAKYKKLSTDPNTKKQINFYETPVEAEDDNIDAIAGILLKISVSSLSDNAVSIARKMADAKIRAFGTDQWIKEVRNRLRVAITELSDETIRAIASVDNLWEGMEKKPEPADVVIAWHRREETTVTVASVKATAKQSINSLLRQKVAEICAVKGWNYVQSRQLKGLRHRVFGGNGYYLVEPTEGVPSNLYIAGVATIDAERIIAQLEQLMK